ncbi:hypothetical protein BST81_26105 [Leptolyngbya sp. 'hensonii']|uniref:hypothetical protein n=1 Tax=Leptolyngbya sp. 'hensonii' TaxID=1922337 RepID=UPI00095032B1|nr:hypothetical protein [Leptolyngbya sp. 'hensonii']OLP15464.1 hypothetical protein BST81_26105 [Leptolyngbya sp. 'hensonii']
MGIYHFIGVGRSVGTVTCAVDYIERALDEVSNNTGNEETIQLFKGSGGINHTEENKGKIEALVLFTSKEVISREILAFQYAGNDTPGNVRDEIIKVLRQVWKRKDHDEGGKIFWCDVDIDNYQDCFDKVIKAAYRFSPIRGSGKEIWCNLTGGSNAIVLALLSMSQLAGKSIKQYLISQRKEYQKEIKVPMGIKIRPNQDGYFNTIPFLRTYIDTVGFYEVLMELDSIVRRVETSELLSRLRSKTQFTTLSEQEFVRRYMLKLYGLGYTDYQVSDRTSEITELGRQFIEELGDLEVVLCLEEKLLDQTIDIVQESKKWSWFQEIDVV